MKKRKHIEQEPRSIKKVTTEKKRKARTTRKGIKQRSEKIQDVTSSGAY